MATDTGKPPKGNRAPGIYTVDNDPKHMRTWVESIFELSTIFELETLQGIIVRTPMYYAGWPRPYAEDGGFPNLTVKEWVANTDFSYLDQAKFVGMVTGWYNEEIDAWTADMTPEEKTAFVPPTPTPRPTWFLPSLGVMTQNGELEEHINLSTYGEDPPTYALNNYIRWALGGVTYSKFIDPYFTFGGGVFSPDMGRNWYPHPTAPDGFDTKGWYGMPSSIIGVWHTAFWNYWTSSWGAYIYNDEPLANSDLRKYIHPLPDGRVIYLGADLSCKYLGKPNAKSINEINPAAWPDTYHHYFRPSEPAQEGPSGLPQADGVRAFHKSTNVVQVGPNEFVWADSQPVQVWYKGESEEFSYHYWSWQYIGTYPTGEWVLIWEGDYYDTRRTFSLNLVAAATERYSVWMGVAAPIGGWGGAWYTNPPANWKTQELGSITVGEPSGDVYDPYGNKYRTGGDFVQKYTMNTAQMQAMLLPALVAQAKAAVLAEGYSLEVAANVHTQDWSAYIYEYQLIQANDPYDIWGIPALTQIATHSSPDPENPGGTYTHAWDTMSGVVYSGYVNMVCKGSFPSGGDAVLKASSIPYSYLYSLRNSAENAYQATSSWIGGFPSYSGGVWWLPGYVEPSTGEFIYSATPVKYLGGSSILGVLRVNPNVGPVDQSLLQVYDSDPIEYIVESIPDYPTSLVGSGARTQFAIGASYGASWKLLGYPAGFTTEEEVAMSSALDTLAGTPTNEVENFIACDQGKAFWLYGTTLYTISSAGIIETTPTPKPDGTFSITENGGQITKIIGWTAPGQFLVQVDYSANPTTDIVEEYICEDGVSIVLATSPIESVSKVVIVGEDPEDPEAVDQYIFVDAEIGGTLRNKITINPAIPASKRPAEVRVTYKRHANASRLVLITSYGKYCYDVGWLEYAPYSGEYFLPTYAGGNYKNIAPNDPQWEYREPGPLAFADSPIEVPPVILGEDYNLGVNNTTGGIVPLTSFIEGDLPEGLTFDAETGLISGTSMTPPNPDYDPEDPESGDPYLRVPSGIGDDSPLEYPITIRITDSEPQPDGPAVIEEQVILLLSDPDNASLEFDMDSLYVNGIVHNVSQTHAFKVLGGKAPYTWIAGGVPTGMDFIESGKNGVLQGIPDPSLDTEIPWYMDISVSDSHDPPWVINRSIPLTIYATIPLEIVSTSLAVTVQKTVAVDHEYVGAVGTLPYTFAITGGTLPDGLVLDPETGALTGTVPAEYTNGVYNVLITIYDSHTPAWAKEHTTVITITNPPEPP